MSGVPNVELITLVCMLAGGALGARLGFLTGVLAEGIYSLASPYGVPLPPLLIAQMLGMGTSGLVGGLTAGLILRQLGSGRRMRGALLSMVFGLGVTVVFDVLTNYGIVLGYGMDARVVFVNAIPFALLHLAGNAPLFLVIYPLLLLRMAGLARSSRRTYLDAVERLIKYYWRSPAELTEQQVSNYVLERHRQNPPVGTFRVMRFALRFFFQETLGRDWRLFKKNETPAPDAAAKGA